MKTLLAISLLGYSVNTQASYLDVTNYKKEIIRTKTELNAESSFNNGGCSGMDLEQELKRECFKDGYRRCLTIKRSKKIKILSHTRDTGWISKDTCEVHIKGTSLKMSKL